VNGAEKEGGPFNKATQLRCTNERVTMAEPDMHAGVGEKRWRRRAIGRGRERGRKKRSANAGCVLAHVRGLGWVALAWLTEVEVEVVVVAGQSKSELRGAGELGSWGAGPTRVTCAEDRGSSSFNPCACSNLAFCLRRSNFELHDYQKTLHLPERFAVRW
jgi:hypothetical protein